jgi:hypothetical protein
MAVVLDFDLPMKCGLVRGIADALDGATRHGADTDSPEGARYIMLSDTQAAALSRVLREICDAFPVGTNSTDINTVRTQGVHNG